MKRQVRVGAFAGLLVGGVALSSGCAGDLSRCGRNRMTPTGATVARTTQPGTPYCVVVEAEGVGNLNVTVNTPQGERASESEATGPGGAPATPLVYTLATPGNASFVDICNTPGARRVLPGVDDATAQIPETDAPPIPFPVRMYDVLAVPPFTVSSNGWLSLVSGAPLGPLSGQLPAATAPNLVAAPYWTDLRSRSGVCYGTVGTAPNRAFVVEWEDAMEWGGGGANAHVTVEVIIREVRAPLAHNVIDLAYDRIEGVARPNPGAGIENDDGTIGVVVPPPLTGSRFVRFTPSR